MTKYLVEMGPINKNVCTYSMASVPDDTKYVISRLLSLYLQYNWNKDCYKNLKVINNMIVDRSICEYLFDLDFKDIAVTTIQRMRKVRSKQKFLGVVMEILAKICQGLERNILTQEELFLILKFLSKLDSSAILFTLQIFKEVRSKPPSVFHDKEQVAVAISSILVNSKDKQILEVALDVASLCNESEISEGAYCSLYNASFTAFYNLNRTHNTNIIVNIQKRYSKSMFKIITNMCMHYKSTSLARLKQAIEDDCKQNIKGLIDNFIKYYSIEGNIQPFPKDIWNYYSTISLAIEVGLYDFDFNMFVYMMKTMFMHTRFFNTSDTDITTCLMWPIVKFIEVIPMEEFYAKLGCLAHMGVLNYFKYMRDLPVFKEQTTDIDKFINFLESKGCLS